ncbi:MAG: hypothetical protein WAV31_05060 [Candidatus Moraniibacteriota bacterium]
MTKVTKPNKEFWETEKRPSYMKISKIKNDKSEDGYIIRFKTEKSKKKKLKS